MPKVPDSDSLHRADHFALVFRSWGILGPEIQAKIVSNCFSQFFGHFWPRCISKTSDSESSHLADYFALVISSRGGLGLDIQAKIVSNCFCLFSGTSGHEMCQKYRIRTPCIVLIILHRLSALEAFWGSIFRPKSFQIVFVYFRALLGMKRTKNTGFGFLASC